MSCARHLALLVAALLLVLLAPPTSGEAGPPGLRDLIPEDGALPGWTVDARRTEIKKSLDDTAWGRIAPDRGHVRFRLVQIVEDGPDRRLYVEVAQATTPAGARKLFHHVGEVWAPEEFRWNLRSRKRCGPDTVLLAMPLKSAHLVFLRGTFVAVASCSKLPPLEAYLRWVERRLSEGVETPRPREDERPPKLPGTAGLRGMIPPDGEVPDWIVDPEYAPGYQTAKEGFDRKDFKRFGSRTTGLVTFRFVPVVQDGPDRRLKVHVLQATTPVAARELLSLIREEEENSRRGVTGCLGRDTFCYENRVLFLRGAFLVVCSKLKRHEDVKPYLQWVERKLGEGKETSRPPDRSTETEGAEARHTPVLPDNPFPKEPGTNGRSERTPEPEEKAPPETTREDGRFEDGGHADDGSELPGTAGWNRSGLSVTWKGERYVPARIADADGRTMHHLWLKEGGARVKDPDRVDELFALLLVLRGESPEALRRQGQVYADHAGSYAAESATYGHLAGFATAVDLAGEVLELYVGLQTGTSGFWNKLAAGSGSLNVLDHVWSLWSFYESDATAQAYGTKELVRSHRAKVRGAVLGVVGGAAGLKSLADAAGKVAGPLAAKAGLLKGATIEADYDKVTGRLEAADIFSLVRSVEDTKAVAKGAFELALLNRTAYALNLQLADLYRRAADDRILDADELLLLPLLELQAAQVRQDLLVKLRDEFHARAPKISGSLGAIWRWVSGASDPRRKAQSAIDMNRDLIGLLEERSNRTWLALELQTRATLEALGTRREPSTWRVEPVQPTPEERRRHVDEIHKTTNGNIGVAEVRRCWQPGFEPVGGVPVSVPRDVVFLEPTFAGWSRVREDWETLRRAERVALAPLSTEGAGASFLRGAQEAGGRVAETLTRLEAEHAAGQSSGAGLTVLAHLGERAGAWHDARRRRLEWEEDLHRTYFDWLALGTLLPGSGERLRGLLLCVGEVTYFFALGRD